MTLIAIGLRSSITLGYGFFWALAVIVCLIYFFMFAVQFISHFWNKLDRHRMMWDDKPLFSRMGEFRGIFNPYSYMIAGFFLCLTVLLATFGL